MLLHGHASGSSRSLPNRSFERRWAARQIPRDQSACTGPGNSGGFSQRSKAVAKRRAEAYDAAIWTFLHEYRIKANEEENNHVIGMTPGARLELIRYANSVLKQ